MTGMPMGGEGLAVVDGEADGRAAVDARSDPAPVDRRVTIGLAVVFALLVAVPVLVAGIAILGRTWTPIGDEAVIGLRVSDVGTSATPLVGVYSTRGWAHPGPALFYVFAVFSRLSGGSDMAMFTGSAIVHAAAVVATVVAAWRRGRLALVAITTIGLALLLHGLRPELLVWPWNPYVGLVAYVLFLFAMWSIVASDWIWLPVAVGIGSVLIQLHVAYVPLVGAAAVSTVAVVWLIGRVTDAADADGRTTTTSEAGADPEAPGSGGAAPVVGGDRAGGNDNRVSRRPSRRCVVVSIVIGALVWLPVAIDLAFGSHNLGYLAHYFVSPKDQVIGLATGAGILSRHLGPLGPWTGGDEVAIFLDVQPGSLITLLVFLALTAGLAVLGWRRGCRATAGLMVLTGVQLLAGAVAASRLEPPVLAYLVVWMLPLAMFTWVSVAWAMWDIVVRPLVAPSVRKRSLPVRRAIATALVVLALLAVVAPIARTGSAWAEAPVPRQYDAAAVESIVAQLDGQLPPDATVRVETVGDLFAEGGVGVLAGLIRSGRTVYTSDGERGSKWGSERTWDGQPVDDTLSVVVALSNADPDPIAACAADPGVTEIAAFEALTPEELEEFRSLAIERFVNAGALPDEKRVRLEDLEARYYRIAVFRGDHVCG